MISEALADEIRRLLAAGTQSMRKIARTTGASRGTVAAIAHGTRRERPARRTDCDEHDAGPVGPIERCPECGALAHTPCLACRVRKHAGVRRDESPRHPREETIQLELAGECRLRYEELRDRRMREGWED